LPESFQTTVNISRVGMIFSRVGGCPPCPPRAGAHMAIADEYRSRRWMWSTLPPIDRQKFMTLAGELSWQRLRRSAVPEISLCSLKF